MVTIFNSEDLIDFSTFILSDVRTEMVKKNYKEDKEISLEHVLKQVYPADLRIWVQYKEEQAAKANKKSKVDE